VTFTLFRRGPNWQINWRIRGLGGIGGVAGCANINNLLIPLIRIPLSPPDYFLNTQVLSVSQFPLLPDVLPESDTQRLSAFTAVLPRPNSRVVLVRLSPGRPSEGKVQNTVGYLLLLDGLLAARRWTGGTDIALNAGRPLRAAGSFTVELLTYRYCFPTEPPIGQ